MEAIHYTKVFRTLDVRLGYHQVGFRDSDKEKTTFWKIDEDGKEHFFQWSFLPFGLKNAPTDFQRVMDYLFSDLEFVKYYIDDIIVYSTS